MPKDILTTIRDVENDDNLTESQKGRLVDPQITLINFVNSHLQKVSSKNALKEALENGFKDELEDGSLSIGARLKLFEILATKETDAELGALNVISKMLEVKADKNKGNEPNGNTEIPSTGLDKETIQDSQGALAFINKLRNTEGLSEFFEKKNKQ